MSRVQFITHKGKRILYFDLSSCKIAEISAVVAEAKRTVAAQAPGSVLALTNVTDTELSKDSSAAIKDFTSHNKPFIKASAVIGVEGLRKVIYNAAMAFSGRTISAFATIEQAKDWLAAQ
jgi:hypothetical protein